MKKLPFTLDEPFTTVGIETEVFDIKKPRYLEKLEERGWSKINDASISPHNRKLFWVANPRLKEKGHKDDNGEGIELISPVIGSDLPQELPKDLHLINSLNARTSLPCALHNHFGIRNRVGEKNMLETAKQLAIVYAYVEKKIDFLDSPLTTNLAEALIGEFKTLSKATAELAKCESLEKLRDIIHPGSNEQITNRTEPYHSKPRGRRWGGLNIYPLGESKGTVEFRKHPGTTSEVQIAAWYNLTNFIVGFAVSIVENNGWESRVLSESEKVKINRAVDKFVQQRNMLAR